VAVGEAAAAAVAAAALKAAAAAAALAAASLSDFRVVVVSVFFPDRLHVVFQATVS
jgi:hypothetical protein